MSSSGAEISKAGPVQAPYHRLNRSISEVPNKISRAHRHHHPHLHRRDKDEQSTRSSLQPGTTLDVPKSEAVTPNESRSVSRRTSILGSADESVGMVLQRQPVNEAELKAEREKSALRATELRKSLLDLNALSNDTTRRLDTAYYSVLEKLGMLHCTIASLKDLARRTRSLNDEFNLESREIVSGIETQLISFENFSGQEKKVKLLQDRIEAGRETVQALGTRVDVVKMKIEGWEKVEMEWQQRTRKRLKILWAFIGLATLALVLFLIFQYTPARTQGPGVLHGIDLKNITISLTGLEDRLSNETLRLRRTAVGALEKLRRTVDEELGDDPRLRGFDEL